MKIFDSRFSILDWIILRGSAPIFEGRVRSSCFQRLPPHSLIPSSLARPRRAFTLVEVLVATAVTALLAGLMITVISNVMSAWRRSADTLQTNAQAKLALDYFAQDLGATIMRRDSRTWLIATVQPDQTGIGDAGGTLGSWNATGSGMMKSGWASPGSPTSSLELAPASNRLEDYRFGMAGVWLRLVAGVPDSNNPAGTQQTSAPRVVGYQIVRHALSSSSTATATRYALFRAEVRPFHDTAGSQAASTLVNGYDLGAAAYTTATANNLADTGNIRRPRRDILLANNIVDFGVRFFVRDAAGTLVLAFPTSNTNRGFAATTNMAFAPGGSSFTYSGAAMTYGFPEVAEVFVRVLSEDGARQIEALESGRLPGLDWWTIVTANSQVYTRRIVIVGRPL
jgi:prepilin-type N-terminal cleavage/methylation domain-containing protein